MSIRMCISQHKLSPSFYFCLLHTLPQKAPWLVTSLVQTHLERPDVRILEVILLSFLVRGQNVDVVEDTDVSRVLAPIRTHPLLNPVWPPRFVTFLRKFVTFWTMPFSSLYFLALCLAESSETWTEPQSAGPVPFIRTFCRDKIFLICTLTGGSWALESWLLWLSHWFLHLFNLN